MVIERLLRDKRVFGFRVRFNVNKLRCDRVVLDR